MRVAELYGALGVRPDERQFKAAEKRIQRFGARVNGMFGGIRKRLNSGLGGTVAGLFGAGALTAGIRSSFRFSKALTDLDIASNGAMGSIAGVRKQILGVSTETGVAKEEILKGAAAFVALTGDGKAATQTMETFARVNKATGSSMEDISASAAAMTQNLGISTGELERGFSILVAGGKAGAVELKDMAGLLAGLAPKAARFAGGSGVGGLAKLGSAFQIARQGFGSAAETATGLDALMGSIVKNSKKIEGKGIQVFNKDGTLREFDEIVKAIADKGLRADQLINLFGRKEAEAAFLQLTKNRGAWDKLTASTLRADDVAKDYAKRQASDTAKQLKAINTIKNAWEVLGGVIIKAVGWLLDEETWTDVFEFWEGGLDKILRKAKALTDWVEGDTASYLESKGSWWERNTGLIGENAAESRMPKSAGHLAPITIEQRKAAIRRANELRALPEPTRPTRPIRDRAKSMSVVSMGDVVVNVPPGTDANGVAREVRKEVGRFWDKAMRQAAAATGE